jgi:uncharacterized phage-associated protein
MMQTIVTVFDVARHIIKTLGGEISPMKLQKLCYYCQAWHIVFNNGKSFFKERFLKWDCGPVCKELWEETRGKRFVNVDDIPGEDYPFDREQNETSEYVLSKYGKLDPFELSALTNCEDPWKNAERNSEIDETTLLEYYFDRWGNDDDDDGEEFTYDIEDIEMCIRDAESNSEIYPDAASLIKALHEQVNYPDGKSSFFSTTEKLKR